MGADKNSSPKRELGLCPKFKTKDPHTSLPKSSSHNGRTNSRSKPQTIPKWKRNSKSKGLSSSALDQADRPQAPGRPSVRFRRTVRRHRADRPQGLGGLFPGTGWTVREDEADCPRGCSGPSKNNPRTSSTAPSITDYPRWARGPSAPSRTVRHSSTDRPRTPCNKNQPKKWIERKTRKNLRRTRRTLGLSGSSRTVHHVPADCPPRGIPAARAQPL
jgi:hypothetical protein